MLPTTDATEQLPASAAATGAAAAGLASLAASFQLATYHSPPLHCLLIGNQEGRPG